MSATIKKRPLSPRSQAGVALIEFALVIPVLIMLLVGLAEIGRLAYFAIQVGNAAHAGAEYGSLSFKNAVDTTGMTNAAKNDGQNSISALTVTYANDVCTCWNGTTQNPSPPANSQCGAVCTTGRGVTYVNVTVQGTINALFNYSALGLPNQWIVTRTAIMRVTPRAQ